MTQITITRNVSGHKAGDTIDTSTSAAQYLIDAGYADAFEVDDKPKRGRPAKGDPNDD